MNSILVDLPTPETAVRAACCQLQAWLSAVLLTDEIHADPVPSIHFFLYIPVDHQVLRVPYGVIAAADQERGAAV